VTKVNAAMLRKGDTYLVEQGDFIPADGEVIVGVASVDESAITGESAPVIREAGGDFSSVTGGTRVLSDWLVVRVTTNPGESFLDRMISMVESARRQKTAERNRTYHSACQADARIFVRDGDTAAIFDLRCRSREVGQSDNDHGARRLARLPDPDDDRGLAVGDRFGGHRPHVAGECNCNFRSCS
jgi:hypothetical protein